MARGRIGERSMTSEMWTRRRILYMGAIFPFGLRAMAETSALPGTAIPVGIEMYSVREALAKDPTGTVRAVAEAGYAGLEFYAPYFAWSVSEAKEMRKLLDDLGIRCLSTHNDSSFFAAEKLGHAREVNLILGSKYVVMSSSHESATIDGWKKVAETLNAAKDKLAGCWTGGRFHNSQPERKPVDG